MPGFERHKSRLSAGASLLLLGLAAPALAQTGAQGATTDANTDIIVTATKRATTVQDVPFSINAQTQEDIQRSGAVTLEDLSRNVAGLTVQNLGPGQSQVSVRGVSAGQIVRDQPGVKEQVGVYLDESVVSLSLFTPDFDLFDLNRVETLRGPQGTLFGSGSVGGTIRYITNQPNTERVEGQVEGNLNVIDGGSMGGSAKGAVNLPLSEMVAVRAVGYYTRYGGFIDALREGGGIDRNVNDGERYGGRLSMLFKPADGISITPRVVYQKVTADGFNRQEVYNLFANPFTTTRPAITLGKRQQYLLLDEAFSDETFLADLTANFDIGAVTLTSVTSYINRDILVSRDASALTGSVSVDLGFPAAAVLLPSNLRDTTDLETFTQEVRLASNGSGPFQWLIGGFYSDIDRGYTQRLPTPGYDAFTDAALGAGTSAAVANGFPANSPYNSDIPYKIKQKAVFGEASYDFGQLKLTAGGRYYDFKETRDFVSGGLFANGDRRIGDKTKSDGFTPRFIVTYEPSANVSVNLQAAKGFRLGGVNDPLNLPLCSGGATGPDAATYGNRPTYKDETLWNYELGVKSQFAGITFNAAGFYNDIKNLQVTADAGSCSSRVVFNVPKAHAAGVEMELSARPAPGFTLGINGTYVESKFDSSVVDANGVVIAGIRDGNRLPTVPKFQFSANADYEFPIRTDWTGYVDASIQHVGSRYTQPSDQENNPRTFVHGLPFGGAPATAATTVDLKLPNYQLVNLSVGVRTQSGFELTAYVHNLFDTNPLLSFDRERGGRARLGFNVGQPRTYGITARQKF
ncbi:TonB-dependent receptor [Sphingomonas sp. MAH-20]|uniref:TonB-dependent receptor n=1 Tax=Sphingomonas horti TaxID=2682842 RepID=A0A6I4J736_9SPHN|nr:MULTISPECIES: TonB-dependent receptor [Sphingomonas]MBA2918720.1 TonB-dependent receptor [Sphingomonas sp. CGMCC 1.13658]MVO78751.1 TonB-dependent receptor [Sphingomonas horti]